MLPKIYAYLDYRQYLADAYKGLCEERGKFSKREFARIAGSPSPNFLQFISERRLHISAESVSLLAVYFGLSQKETRYFDALVAFDHARTHDEKDSQFREILSLRAGGSAHLLNEQQYDYLSHWYMPVIRELVTSSVYPGNPEWIAEQITPPISASAAKKGVALLEKLELIRKDPTSGAWMQVNRILSTPSEVISVGIITYYKSILLLARNAVEQFGPDERDIRGVTVGISHQTYDQIKGEMELFWKQIMDKANEPQKIERVYHVGLHLFPLSKDLHE